MVREISLDEDKNQKKFEKYDEDGKLEIGLK